MKRKIPFNFQDYKKEFEGIDQKILYVENLPERINLDLAAKVFNKCGDIIYINMPKYKDGLNKGYAFIEYENKEQC